jgi:hypothetical protein
MRWACAAALAFVLLAAAAPAGAGPAYDVKVVGRLPSGNYRAALVDTGDAVYLMGGRNGTATVSSVVRYDKPTGKAAPAGWSLPEPRMSAAAAYDGNHAYVFGGADGGTELDTILEIDVATGKTSTLEARLPSPRIGLVAAMSGGKAYLFGGHSNGTMISAVLRFDPASGNLSVMGASLPAGLAGMGASADSRGIFLFGGNTGSDGADRVMAYDPARDNLTVLPERLPYQVYHAPAVPFEGRILVVGGSAELLGWEVSRATDTIIEFDPATGHSRILPQRLHSPRERTSAALAGNRVLVFGGQEGVKALDEVVAVSAAGGNAPGDRGMWPAVAAVAFLAPAAVVLYVVGRRP